MRKQAIKEISQLEPPFLLLGDMNARSLIWGELTTDVRGKMFEELLLEEDIALLNDKSPTHYHIQTGTYSTIDLLITSADCLGDFTYKALQDLHDSDHYPIQLMVEGEYSKQDTVERYNTAKADWTLFKGLTQTE